MSSGLSPPHLYPSIISKYVFFLLCNVVTRTRSENFFLKSISAIAIAVFFDIEKKMDVREYRLREHQHFAELIDPQTVRCKCGSKIRLDRPYAPKNLKKHAGSSACLYSKDGQTNLGMFFGKQHSDGLEMPCEEHPALVCQGLSGDEYQSYITKTPVRFGGGKRAEVIGRELFPEKFAASQPFSRKKLSKMERETFDKATHAASSWEVFKEFNCIKSTDCENYTQNESQICNECISLRANKRFREALKLVSIITWCTNNFNLNRI